jgi:hypothetical protein
MPSTSSSDAPRLSLSQGQGKPVGPGQYQDYKDASDAPGEMKMHDADKIAQKGAEHELKKGSGTGSAA